MAGSGSGDELVAEETAAAGEPALPDVERLVAELVAARSDSTEDGVVLDVEVGGSRYTLRRQAATIRTADAPLSAREQEIARMVALGYTNKAIAAVLEISTWTVGTHLRRLYGKLGVHSRSAMVAHLLQDGALPATTPAPEWQRMWRSP
ncbi:MAG: hypothetical protein QOF75_1266 [Gaiellaceae bacterium]|jgi:DNA-binding CsgD family transcriptional regulator|nr:hypothetical protein [Gaiellaceae bacterium]MDX6472431.1 hypothetical protein [Gaiellaceae bacterium]